MASQCTMCDKGNAQMCNRCKSAFYCSKTCQRADWPAHKLLCASFADFEVLSRPTGEHVRAILFPVREEKPEVVWVHCKWDPVADGSDHHQTPDLSIYIGAGRPGHLCTIQKNAISGKLLSNTLHLYCPDVFGLDGFRSNNSIAMTVAAKSKPHFNFWSPVIALARKGLGDDLPACKDINLTEFHHVVDWLVTYNAPHLNPSPSTDEKVQGVRINCTGDQKVLNKPLYEAVQVSSSDIVFPQHDTSGIAQRIGIPVLTRRLPHDSSWVNPEPESKKKLGKESPFDNQEATFLHLCCNPKADINVRTGQLGWGFAPMHWQKGVGSVLIVRQDRKPLLRPHVEALCDYSRHQAGPIFEHSIGGYAPEEPLSRAEALQMICRASFVIHWYKYIEEKTQDAPYPYNNLELIYGKLPLIHTMM